MADYHFSAILAVIEQAQATLFAEYRWPCAEIAVAHLLISAFRPILRPRGLYSLLPALAARFSLSPMAIACFWLLTGLPEPPLLSVPAFHLDITSVYGMVRPSPLGVLLQGCTHACNSYFRFMFAWWG